MPSSRSNKRSTCQHCQRPKVVCLCAFVKKIDNPIKVTIFRHPSEVNNAKGTARLTQLSLSNCTIIDTETVELPTIDTAYQRLLLFPPIHSSFQGVLGHKTIQPGEFKQWRQQNIDATGIELIVLDGTWKKARKMYYLSSDLQKMTTLHLSIHAQTSQYYIRKAEKAGQLSTLEAIATALGDIENCHQKYRPLLTLQRAMMDKQLAFMNKEAQLRYLKKE